MRGCSKHTDALPVPSRRRSCWMGIPSSCRLWNWSSTSNFKEGIIWINLGTFIEIYSMGFKSLSFLDLYPTPSLLVGSFNPFQTREWPEWTTIRRFSTGLLLGCASHICKWFIIHIYWGYSIHSMYIYIYVHIYVYIYTYVYICINMYIYIIWSMLIARLRCPGCTNQVNQVAGCLCFSPGTSRDMKSE